MLRLAPYACSIVRAEGISGYIGHWSGAPVDAADRHSRVFRTLATRIAEKLSQVSIEGLSVPKSPVSNDHVYLDTFPITIGSPQEDKLIGREQRDCPPRSAA